MVSEVGELKKVRSKKFVLPPLSHAPFLERGGDKAPIYGRRNG